MFDLLRKYKLTRLCTLNNFVKVCDDLADIKSYEQFLKNKPKITDFIAYDMKGFKSKEPQLFKSWTLCKEASSKKNKVAKFKENRIYFNTTKGLLLINKVNATDNLTYNSLAVFFNGNLKIRNI